jgi:hypothetical protein
MVRTLSRSLLISALALLFPAAARTFASYSYGNLAGDNYVYQQVTEDSTTDPGVALFGAPGITGDVIYFNPVSFGAFSQYGSGTDQTDGTLTTNIQTRNVSVIDKIRFVERGDYTLDGGGTAITHATVNASLFVTVTHTDSGPVFYQDSVNFTFTPSDGTYNLIDDPGVAKLWSGGITYDVTALLRSWGESGFATQVSITLDNALVAQSEANSTAQIKKKSVAGMTIEAVNVPEPATFAFLALAALPLLARKRRA